MDPGGVRNESQLFLSHWADSAALPRYLHDGTELRLILHLLLGNPPLDTGQDRGLEEVPPVVMERPEKELKQLSLHIRGGALWRHTQILQPSLLVAHGATHSPGPEQERPTRGPREAWQQQATHQLLTHTPILSSPLSQQFKPGVPQQKQGHT